VPIVISSAIAAGAISVWRSDQPQRAELPNIMFSSTMHRFLVLAGLNVSPALYCCVFSVLCFTCLWPIKDRTNVSLRRAARDNRTGNCSILSVRDRPRSSRANLAVLIGRKWRHRYKHSTFTKTSQTCSILCPYLPIYWHGPESPKAGQPCPH
jgi:hypothetical protein